jgi:hypothetical protein
MSKISWKDDIQIGNTRHRTTVRELFELGLTTINVQAYGAVGDGVTDDTAAIQAALDVAKATGGFYRSVRVFIPTGTYRVTACLDMTDRRDMIIQGESTNKTILLSEATGKPTFDLCGSKELTFRNFTVKGHTVQIPKCAFFHARSTRPDGAGSSTMHWDNVHLEGVFETGWYMNCSELMTWSRCFIASAEDTAGVWKYGIYLNTYNEEGYASEYSEVRTDIASGIWNVITDCKFFVENLDSNFIPIMLGECSHGVTILKNYTATHGPCHIRVVGFNENLTIRDHLAEHKAPDFIQIKRAATPNLPSQIWRMKISNVTAKELLGNILVSEAGMDIFHSTIEEITGPHYESNIVIEGNLYFSHIRSWWTIDYDNPGLRIGKAVGCYLEYPDGSLTMTESGRTWLNQIASLTAPGVKSTLPGLSVGKYGEENQATITRIFSRRITDWVPGTIPDGGIASTTVDFPGTMNRDLAIAHLSITPAGIFLSANNVGNAVRVDVLNMSGASWTPEELDLHVMIFHMEY